MNSQADELAAARDTIRELHEELEQTHEGLLQLALELEQRVDARTLELRAAQEELERTNRELMQLTLELEERVAERTRELLARTEQLQIMTEQLTQAAKLATLGELAASVAHELNNPLARVKLHVEALLTAAGEGDPRRRGLRIIDEESDRMAGLVANLLEFSRRSQRQVTTVDARVELESALELLDYYLRSTDIRVVREYQTGRTHIHADRQQLRQVFLNLITNARDAMPDGGTLLVRLLAAGDRLAIDIQDTGCGISPDLLHRVREPFFTTKPEGKGTGLGLGICQRILQEHEGTLAISSEPGRGTAVRITLPSVPME